jgi:hypothetical protein
MLVGNMYHTGSAIERAFIVMASLYAAGIPVDDGRHGQVKWLTGLLCNARRHNYSGTN